MIQVFPDSNRHSASSACEGIGTSRHLCSCAAEKAATGCTPDQSAIKGEGGMVAKVGITVAFKKL